MRDLTADLQDLVYSAGRGLGDFPLEERHELRLLMGLYYLRRWFAGEPSSQRKRQVIGDITSQVDGVTNSEGHER